MVCIIPLKKANYYDRQILAINAFYDEQKKLQKNMDFETAFVMWITQGYADRFRHLFLVDRSQIN